VAKVGQKSLQSLVPGGAVAVAYVLLGIYLLPSVLFLEELYRTSAQTDSFLMNWFFALANDKGMAMSELHHLILPVITGMSVATLKRDPGPAVWVMLVACLVGFVLILAAQVMLDVEAYRQGLTGLGIADDHIAGARGFLSVQRANLLLYFSVMAGLKASSQEGDA